MGSNSLFAIIILMESLKFTDDFLWGSATSSYQVEGGIENNDWTEAARAGRVPAAGQAADHWHLYKKDFDIARELRQNAHRFSIEWARVEPEEGKFNEQAIKHYRDVLRALRARGLEPFVTLWHFTLPIWFSKKGGFENRKAPEIFARYCSHVVEQLGDIAKFWITINEPTVYAGESFVHGHWPPFKKNFLTSIKVINTIAVSHNLAYKKTKIANPNLKIGLAFNTKSYESDESPFNRLLSILANYFRNHWFLLKIRKNQDFIGANYYFHRKFGEKYLHEKTDMGWEIYPKGIYNVLMQLKKYRKPIYITENGIADAKDTKRAKFIKDHLHWVHRAIHDGVDARGYFYWSLLDNFEWAHSFGPRFGLVEVNYQTQERHIRPSAYEYKKICENNSL